MGNTIRGVGETMKIGWLEFIHASRYHSRVVIGGNRVPQNPEICSYRVECLSDLCFILSALFFFSFFFVGT